LSQRYVLLKTCKICFRYYRYWRSYGVVENAIVTVSKLKKADNIPDNNFNKFKRTFIILLGNIKKSNVQLRRYR